jgi:hypothetical protein
MVVARGWDEERKDSLFRSGDPGTHYPDHAHKGFGRKLNISHLLGTLQVHGSRFLGGSGCPTRYDAHSSMLNRGGYSGSLADCVDYRYGGKTVMPKLNLAPAGACASVWQRPGGGVRGTQ